MANVPINTKFFLSIVTINISSFLHTQHQQQVGHMQLLKMSLLVNV